MTTYYVDGVSGNDAHAGTSFGTAFATIAHAESVVAAGDTINICATGTYTVTSSLSLATSGDFTTGPITWIGANASGVVDGTMPTITTATNSVYLISLNGKSNRVFRYLNLTCTAVTPAGGIAALTGNATYIAIKDCSITGFKDGIYGGNLEGSEWLIGDLTVSDCYIANCTRDAIRAAASTDVIACGLYNNGGVGVNVPTFGQTYDSILITDTIFASCATGISQYDNAAATTAAQLSVVSCTVADSTNDGLDWLPAAGHNVIVTLENSLFYGNGGYGANLTNSAALVATNRYNAYGSNTSGARHNLPVGTGDVSLSSNPFAQGVTISSLATLRQYYALNSTAGGGASCRGAGYPSYLDIGALQHQDAGGASTAPNYGMRTGGRL